MVRLYVASALQRLPFETRRAIGRRIVGRTEDTADHNLPLLEWVGREPLVAADADAALDLLRRSVHPVLRTYITRRLAEELDAKPGPVDAALRWSMGQGPAERNDVAAGITADRSVHRPECQNRLLRDVHQ